MTALTALAKDSLALLPGDITLTGPAARQVLLVQRLPDQRDAGPITNATFTVSDPQVVRIENGVAFPVGNGTATITTRAGRETASARVTVRDFDQPFEWSFRNHVQPVLAGTGCSMGACHGAAAGQNGFRLSLRGYDDEGDFLSLTRHAQGRRVTPAEPGRSLILLKATATLPHKGGERFQTGSLEYQVLADWIASGAPGPKPDDPRLSRLEVLPPHAVLQPGQTQPVIVRAHFSDGRIEDVTRWAKYSAADTTVANVDDTGRITVAGAGETAVSAWYLSRIATITVTSPHRQKVDPRLFTRAPKRNFIDELVLKKLRDLNLPPSPRCSDSEFIRRAFLDTIGVLPTAEEAREFLRSKSPGKRDELIESLLRRPEFVDYWSYRWSDLLLVNSDKLPQPAMWSYYHWIRRHVEANTPWDRMVRELVTATGSTLENGAGNFFVLHDEPTRMAETVSVAFLGFSINCAKCHNHPMEKWTNDEYFGFANLFARVRAKNGATAEERIIFAAGDGDLVQPLTGRPQPPRPLESSPLPFDSPEDRRLALADWLTAPDNTHFTRTIVNRVWANFFGVGLVEPVDDIRVTNPPSNEKLFAAAADYLVRNRFDLKALMRAILQSETYHRSSQPLPGNRADTRYHARFYPRRLHAEVLLDAISQVTGVPTEFRIDARNANRGLGQMYPAGFRALQLPDSNVASDFLTAFGRPERVTTCSCERTTEPSVAQALHLANGDTLNRKLAREGNRLDDLLGAGLTDAQLIDEAFHLTLARPPTSREKSRMLKTLSAASPSERRVVLEDIFWSLMSSKEFLFNH